jgi:hypothetical protein
MTVYIDECGQHMLTAKAEFHAFVLAAVLIPDDAYPRIDSTWKRWKAAVLGSADKRLHEPDVRKGQGPFFLQGDRARRERAVVALARRLEKTEMRAFACVMHRPEYLEQFGPVPLDSSLPSHPYLMTLHFLAERIVMAMQQEFGGGRAHFIAESRGPLEDAKMQYEFTRLLLDGTSYVSAAWFREYLAPGIEFRDKQANLTGLQLADLLARPCGEKILRPESTPARWPQFRTKLCQGQETANSILGLKIVPWDEKYAGVWLS